jgi:hypothetical protein
VEVVNDNRISLGTKSLSLLVVLDRSQAFDTLNHNILTAILHKCVGLPGTVLNWLTSWFPSKSVLWLCQVFFLQVS